MHRIGKPLPEAKCSSRLPQSNQARFRESRISHSTTVMRSHREAASQPASVYGPTSNLRFKLSPNQDESRAAMAQMPKELNSEFFDIEAQAQGNPTKDQMRLMMQSLLAERFKLAVHFETREASVFVLTLVKQGKAGPRLRPHSEARYRRPTTYFRQIAKRPRRERPKTACA